MSESCANCKFWDHIGGMNGYCRIEPPKIVDNDVEYNKSDGFIGVFPITANNVWCGRFHAEE